MLKTGLDWLTTQMETHAAQAVSYVRGSESVSVSATLSEETNEVLDADTQAPIEWQGVRFEFRRAAISSFGDPRRGDKIIDADGNTYEVGAPVTLPVWRAIDAHGVRISVSAIMTTRAT
jgi:hypothetical protein